MFDPLKSRGVKWDMIGMSTYPRWSHLDAPTMITKVMANIKDLEQRYRTKVMVVETGHYWNKPIEAKQYLVGLMDKLINNGDPRCFYWEPESMAGYHLGAWDQNTKRPTVAMDAFLGIKHTEVKCVIKASVGAPAQEETVSADSEVTLKANVKHIRNRNVNMEFYLDKKKTATVTAPPYEVNVAALKRGVHTLWGKATDSEKHTLTTDTVTFFVGESTVLEMSQKQNADQRGGTQQWGFHLQQGGHYLLAFHYESEKVRGAVVTANADSLTKIYFTKSSDAYLTKEVEMDGGGDYTLTLTSTSTGGLPNIKSLRIFPLDGQGTPVENNLTGIEEKEVDDNDAVVIYSLSGKRIRTTSERQLGISLGARSSAVVMLPNCVGGTPYIVRKQRLK